MRRFLLTLLSSMALIGALALPSVSAAAEPPRVDLKVLLVTSGPSADGPLQLAAWKATLDAVGVPYDTYDRSFSGPVTTAVLQVAPDHGKYNAVILTDGTIMSNWGSASAEEKEAIAGYERLFGVREIADAAGPASGFGLDYSGQGGSPTDLGVSATLTAAGQQIFSYLNPGIVIPYESGLYMYLAVPYYDLPTWNGWSITDVTSFETLVQGPTVVGGSGSPLAPSAIVGIANHADGRQEMVTTVNSSDWTISDKLLHIGMLNWVTRGLYLGSWHNYLSIHFDDVLLSDSRWSITGHCTPGEETGCTAPPTTPIRMTPADVTRAVAWSQANGIRLDLVVNGQGATPAETNGVKKGQNDALTTALLAAKARFGWISHTWSHADLDTATLKTIVDEISKNQTWATANKVPMNPAELVTGGHTGLTNLAMPTALAKTGVTRIAGDASVNPAVRMVGQAIVVPRHPSPVYYNVGTRDEQLDEFNYIYRNDLYVGAPLTWDQYVDLSANEMLRFMVGNDPRPFFAHQDNLAEEGVFYFVADALLTRYRAWFSVPLVQPTMTEAGTLLMQLAGWQSALGAGTVSAYVQSGVVHITATAPVAVPITGTSIGSLYGPLRSGWVSVSPAAPVTIPVP
jgi:hypothetical protein